jgi:hypothetical protein
MLSRVNEEEGMEFERPEAPERRHTGNHLLDVITGVCAVVISIISIFMAVQNGHHMEKLVHANSWPAIELSSSNGDGHGNRVLIFALQNAGIGPARLHRFDLLVDGKAIRGNYALTGILDGCCAETLRRVWPQTPGHPAKRDWGDALGVDTTSPIVNSFLSPRQEVAALSWPRTDRNKDVWDAMDAARQAGRITMRVCYCSVFDECWVAESHKFPPRPVDDCGH